MNIRTNYGRFSDSALRNRPKKKLREIKIEAGKKTLSEFSKKLDCLTRQTSRRRYIPELEESGYILGFNIYLHIIGRRYEIRLPVNTTIQNVVEKIWKHLDLYGEPKPEGNNPNRYIIQGALLQKGGYDAKRIEFSSNRSGKLIISCTASIPKAGKNDVGMKIGKHLDYHLVADLLKKAQVCRPRRVKFIGTERVELFCVLNSEAKDSVSKIVNDRTSNYEMERRKEDPDGKKQILAIGSRKISVGGQKNIEIVEKTYRLNENSPVRYEMRSSVDRPASRNRFLMATSEINLIQNMIADMVEALYEAKAKPSNVPTRRRISRERNRGLWRYTIALKYPYLTGQIQKEIYLAIVRSGGKIKREELTNVLKEKNVKISSSQLSNTILILERMGVLTSSTGSTSSKPHRVNIILKKRYSLVHLSKRVGVKL